MGSFEEAEFFRLRQGLALTPMQRLQDLEDMLQFNDEAEQRNPGLRWAAARLRD
jgi:hypothetical protein